MPPAEPTPPADDFPAGQTGDMRDVLLSPQTEAKPATAPAGPWQPPSAEELQKLLPQYEITALLGRGGMGAVYRGTQIALDRPVAIKILSNTLDEADASFAERFKNEARALGKLSHPGIVGVYDFGEAANGLLYIVMEFIDGTDVAKMLSQQKRLHTEHAMAITAHVCDALAYAHERGIIHRDIKPANIMVGYDGVVKVADFGLAKMTHSQNSGLTQSGMAMGTLHYMAPEALMLGAGVDHRADIYAVGVMLYQMLTGKIPQGLFELPSLQVPGLDPRYDGIIGKALREDRDLRYPSVLDMRHDLDAILTQPVVKVEAAAEKAPAALQTQARPQRPGGQPYRPPQPEVIVRTEKKGSPLLWVALILMSGITGWLVFDKDSEKRGEESPSAPVSETPAAAPVSPAKVIAGTQFATTSNPAEATKDAPFTNSLGMKFVPVSGTKVLFCIHETRRSDYAKFAAEVPNLDGDWKSQDYNGIPCGDKDDHPVVGVSWEDAVKFCDWLSKKEGASYRLSTDEEWSIAVGLGGKENRLGGATPEMLNGKETSEFPWGGVYPPLTQDRAGNYGDTAWIEKFPNEPGLKEYADGFPTTAPVMSFKPNKLGLYDMGGNVWEWVADWWNNAKTDRVLRGAAFDLVRIPSNLLSSRRLHHKPSNRLNRLGFRCVLELASQTTSTTKALVVTQSSGPQPSMPVTIATKEKPFTNSLAMKFVPLPGSSILMCIHETRIQDYEPYARAMKADGTWQNAKKDGIPVEVGPNYPVCGVNWQDANDYCLWLTQKEAGEALLPSGMKYRLPRDEEWSLAVGLRSEDGTTIAMRNGRNTVVFPWGGPFPPKGKAGNYADLAFHEKFPGTQHKWLQDYNDGYPTTAPVMTFQANALGIYDLGGNVNEWCEDAMSVRAHLTRGSSWLESEREVLLASYRTGGWMRQPGHGFRCVLEANNVQTKEAQAFVVPQSANSPLLLTGPTTWTDTKGRSITATFKALASGNVLLDIAGKVTPVPLNSLSAESQKLVRDYQEALEAGAAKATVQPSEISADAFAYGTSRYAYFAEAMNWQEARSRAESVGGHLVTFNTQAEEASVAAQVRARFGSGITNFWIGGILDAPAGSWRWITGEAFTYTHWDAKEPNNANAADQRSAPPFVVACHLNRESHIGWRDYSVSHPNWQSTITGYLVEWDNVPATSQPAPAAPSAAASSLVSPAIATKDKPFVNSLGMKFVPVPGTKVLFCIHETRVKDYAPWAESNAGISSKWRDAKTWDGISLNPGPEFPVVNVSHLEATSYCDWLSKRDNINCRLPTDREWSCAVGLSTLEQEDEGPQVLNKKATAVWPWGETWPPPLKAANIPDKTYGARYPNGFFVEDFDDGYIATAPVMTFEPNSLGIFDLSGNVEEICSSWFDVGQTRLVVRGGGWTMPNRRYIRGDLWSGHRTSQTPEQRVESTGFRIVLELPTL